MANDNLGGFSATSTGDPTSHEQTADDARPSGETRLSPFLEDVLFTLNESHLGAFPESDTVDIVRLKRLCGCNEEECRNALRDLAARGLVEAFADEQAPGGRRGQNG